MADLYVTRALPNPVGKDRSRYGTPNNDQLNAERIEFVNTTSRLRSLAAVTLWDRTFDHKCNPTGERLLATLSGDLPASGVARVHSGSGRNFWDGGILHIYLNRSNYVWNNECGDRVMLKINGQFIDWAEYEPNPPEGVILNRVAGTNRLA